jgi:hypothetical protein
MLALTSFAIGPEIEFEISTRAIINCLLIQHASMTINKTYGGTTGVTF